MGQHIGGRMNRYFKFSISIVFISYLILLVDLCAVAEEGGVEYDIVIKDGTVIDPETGTNEILNVGIKGDKIARLSRENLRGKKVLDASGEYVVPGFIDLCSYGPFYYANFFKVADGVTTNLVLHGGTTDFTGWAEYQRKSKSTVNYGSSVSHHFMRSAVGVKNRYKEATPGQIKDMVKIAERVLKEGAIGVSFSLEYTPGATYREIKPLVRVAAEFGAPCFFHVRYSDPFLPGTNEEAIEEIINLARETDAVCHIHHIHSTGGTFTMKETVEQIENARKEGLKIFADIYPYDFWGTYLGSARFDKGWEKRFGIDYGDLQLAGSTETLNADSFKKYRRGSKVAVAYAIPEEDIKIALKASWVMIASDGIISTTGNSHPRGAGCFSRTISKYVRQEEVIGLDEAIKKMSFLPAKLLETVVPQMKSKGRIQENMDADIVVFDYNKIQDKATVENPKQRSEGITYVLINGIVVRNKDKVRYRHSGKLIVSKNSLP
jgi:dihydroorotase